MNTIYINEEHLGNDATEDEAQAAVEALKARGYNVEYGAAAGQQEGINDIDEDDWNAALDAAQSNR